MIEEPLGRAIDDIESAYLQEPRSERKSMPLPGSSCEKTGWLRCIDRSQQGRESVEVECRTVPGRIGKTSDNHYKVAQASGFTRQRV